MGWPIFGWRGHHLGGIPPRGALMRHAVDQEDRALALHQEGVDLVAALVVERLLRAADDQRVDVVGDRRRRRVDGGDLELLLDVA